MKNIGINGVTTGMTKKQTTQLWYRYLNPPVTFSTNLSLPDSKKKKKKTPKITASNYSVSNQNRAFYLRIHQLQD